MKFQEIKEFVEYYEDRIINNFEKHFSDLILEDFYDGGFEDRLEDELYYEDYYPQYEEGIIDLLLKIENEFDDKYIDFKRRLIILKRTIDTKLSKVAIIQNEKKSLRTEKRGNQFLINPKIDKEKFIKILHHELQGFSLIDIEYSEFRTHFDDNWENKVQWYGIEVEIINLISLLISSDFLIKDTKKIHQLVVTHFITKNGKAFNTKQLSTVKFEKIQSVPSDNRIHKIIKEISTHFLSIIY